MKNREFWVARDSGGQLYLYDSCPKGEEGVFFGANYWELPKEMFPSLTFENSPKKVFNNSQGENWI